MDAHRRADARRDAHTSPPLPAPGRSARFRAPGDSIADGSCNPGHLFDRPGRPPRDHAGKDGIGDVLTLNSSGALTVQRGTGTGTLGAKVSGAGWPTTARFVPFGDLDGDRCNDVLVRLGSGALRAHRPACGKAVTPSTPYTSLGTSGWNQYDVLTAPGDVSGDGRPDLIARNASTGTVYLYQGTGTGKLSARVRLYDDWRTYKKVAGAGDLTGDGRTDLVSRDTDGGLYRNSGDGKGSFGSRTKIATGWQGYRAVA
ncbi:hypothetical protein GCM10019016_069850 [Streptomyces prasinosporus]|uniref:VCBS repeat-containing protein n=1 Tax=Streptomyces prasinosporus TaxID=68256 RepID=A0ABP6TYQ3_9ACTN